MTEIGLEPWKPWRRLRQCQPGSRVRGMTALGRKPKFKLTHYRDLPKEEIARPAHRAIALAVLARENATDMRS